MTALAAIGTHFSRWREWEPNPIVLKELRQSVRSLTVPGVVVLFLVVLFFTNVAFLVGQSANISNVSESGGQIFPALIMILGFACLVFVPLFIGVRLGMERQESNLDLLYVSTLSPGRIIRGKMYCGWYLAILFFSACLPFMTFASLLRGIDMPTIFFIMFCLFLIVCAAIQAAIFLACLPVSRLLKALLCLAGLGGMVSASVGLASLFEEMGHSGIGSLLTAANFLAGFATFLGVGLGAVLLLYFLSVGLIAPESANRALPIRVYITVVWALTGVIGFAWTFHVSALSAAMDPDPLYMWSSCTYAILGAALVVVVSNRDQLSPRVRRAIPANPMSRRLACFFYNGAAGGLLWVAGLTCSTFASLQICWAAWPARSHTANSGYQEWKQFQEITAAAMLYGFDYALTALFLHRQFLPRRTAKLAGVFTLLIPAALAIVPPFVLFLVNRLTWESINHMQLGNLFNLFSVAEAECWPHLIFAAGWLLAALVLNARWFWLQFQRFRRLEPTAPLPNGTASINAHA
jgi:hypothetical protein